MPQSANSQQTEIRPAFAFELTPAEATELLKGRPFDGMAFGEFTDMWGRDFELDEKDAAKYIKNTNKNISLTKDADGEIVGLPIDAMGHNHGEGAGWIVDVQMATNDDTGRSVLQFTPLWTALGIELISSGKLRFFSPEIDIKKKVIVGGSLTNWPATRTDEHEILLRPVALAQPKKNKGESNMPRENQSPVVLSDLSDDEQRALFEQAMEAVQQLQAETPPAAPAAQTPAAPEPAQAQAPTVPDVEYAADLDAVRGQLNTEVEKALRAELDRVKANAGTVVAQMLADMKMKDDVAAFANRIVGGDNTIPFGLPVKRETMEQWLLSLNSAQRQTAMELFTEVQKTGRIAFSELGHNQQATNRELPTEFALALDNGSLSVEDLSNPIIADGLEGQISDYNLSKWSGK